MLSSSVRDITQAVVYLTDCTLATVSELAVRSRPPKRELKRQISMAQGLIDWMNQSGIDYSRTRAGEVSNGGGKVLSWTEMLGAPPGNSMCLVVEDILGDAHALLVFTEFTLATVKTLASASRPTNYELSRQIAIAQLALEWMHRFGVDYSQSKAAEVSNADRKVSTWAAQFSRVR